MTRIGVRQLKNQLSRYLARVKKGGVLAVTARGRDIAVLGPLPTATIPPELTDMVSSGMDGHGGRGPLPTGSTQFRVIVSDVFGRKRHGSGNLTQVRPEPSSK
jgi:prevent-host-death family protein